MRLAVAQPLVVPHDVATNAAAHAALVRAARARVVVFPELSLTGYELDAASVTLSALAPVVEACASTGSLALVGAPVDSHIAVLAVTGAGAEVAYRKMYPGTDEARHFKAGDAPAVIEVDGWRLGLAICRDTGIAAQVEATVALGIDAYVAG